MPLSVLLRQRDTYAVFDEEFRKGRWLDLTALLESEGTIRDLYQDGLVPAQVLDAITERLDQLDEME